MATTALLHDVRGRVRVDHGVPDRQIRLGTDPLSQRVQTADAYVGADGLPAPVVAVLTTGSREVVSEPVSGGCRQT
jgi:hypothetical protein